VSKEWRGNGISLPCDRNTSELGRPINTALKGEAFCGEDEPKL